MNKKKLLILIIVSFLSFVSCATKILIEHFELEAQKLDIATEQTYSSQGQ